MSKIIRFKSKTQNVLDFLDEIKEEVEKNNIQNIMIACKIPESENPAQYSILTGYAGLDTGGKQELLSHIQLDIVKDMINQNYVT